MWSVSLNFNSGWSLILPWFVDVTKEVETEVGKGDRKVCEPHMVE